MERFDTESDNLFESECSSLTDARWERLFRINSGLYLADYCFQCQKWTFSLVWLGGSVFCFRVNIALDFWFCHSWGEKYAENMFWGEVQESSAGGYFFFSLTWKMCSYLNMRTNGLGHVQSYFILPALIPICLSGQQAWIDYSAYCIWREGVERSKKKPGLTSSITARDSPLKPNDTRLTLKSGPIISPYLVMF